MILFMISNVKGQRFIYKYDPGSKHVLIEVLFFWAVCTLSRQEIILTSIFIHFSKSCSNQGGTISAQLNFQSSHTFQTTVRTQLVSIFNFSRRDFICGVDCDFSFSLFVHTNREWTNS